MVEVLIIADDLTGAIDAAAPFIGGDVAVKTDYNFDLSAEDLAQGSRILAVNANTRHLDAAAALERAKALVGAAKNADVAVVLKKTDSVLRGNIGAELEGALAASEQTVAHFLPSFPKIERITTGGVHYIKGVPVAESDLANDPFEPVRHSCVSDILAETSSLKSTSIAEGAELPSSFSGVAIYDAATDESLLTRVRALLREAQTLHAPLLLAGCAGVSNALADALDMGKTDQGVVTPKGKTMAFCGSVNPVSVGQVTYAREAGAPVITIAPAQILDISWLVSTEFDKLIQCLSQKFADNKLVVVDNSSKVTETDMKKAGITSTEELRAHYAENLGRLSSALLRASQVDNMLVMGGDVLLSMLTYLEVNTCSLAAQIAPGVVVFEVELAGRSVRLISKSGGFGEPDMFIKVADMFSDSTSCEESSVDAKRANEQVKEIA